MRVQAWSENLTAERAAEVGVDLAPSKQDLLRSSDVVSLHLVLSDRSRGTIGAAELAIMKPTALLINTSRAGLVDLPALVEALDRPRSAGTASTSTTSSRCRLIMCCAGPRRAGTRHAHLGYVTDGNYRTYFRDAVDDIAAYLAGTPIRVLTEP